MTHFWEQIHTYWAFLARTELLFLQYLLPFPIQRINYRKWGAPSVRRCALPSASISKRLLLVLILVKVYPERNRTVLGELAFFL